MLPTQGKISIGDLCEELGRHHKARLRLSDFDVVSMLTEEKSSYKLSDFYGKQAAQRAWWKSLALSGNAAHVVTRGRDAISFSGGRGAGNDPGLAHGPWTINFYYYPLSFAQYTILMSHPNGQGTFSIKLVRNSVSGMTAGTPYLNMTDSGGAKQLIANRVFTLNAWNMLTVTYDGSVMRIYVNGVFSGQLTTNLNVPAGALFTGNNEISGEYTNGYVSDVSVWHKVLSTEQIAKLLLAM